MDCPRVACSACDGTGATTLVPSLFRVLKMLHKRGPSTATDLVRIEAIAHTAMNNRLEKLRLLGLVTRNRVDGRSWEYSLARRDTGKRDSK